MSKLRVILTKDIASLGRAGEVKEVSAGYARNYLIPQGLAVLATPQEIKVWEAKREKLEKEREAKRLEAQKLAQKLEKLTLEIKLPADEKGHLFGSVSQSEIASKLSEAGFEIEKKKIEVEHLKEVGDYQAVVHLEEGVKAQIKIKVTALKKK